MENAKPNYAKEDGYYCYVRTGNTVSHIVPPEKVEAHITSICFFVGFRFKFIVKAGPGDFTHDAAVAGIWGSLELYLGIISACLPLVSAPMRVLRDKVSSGYASFIRVGQEGDTSDVILRNGSEPKSGDQITLKSWPAYTREYDLEVAPPTERGQSENEMRFQTEWIVTAEKRTT